jgi:hypothetical protein
MVNVPAVGISLTAQVIVSETRANTVAVAVGVVVPKSPPVLVYEMVSLPTAVTTAEAVFTLLVELSVVVTLIF